MTGSSGNEADSERLSRWVREHGRAVRAFLLTATWSGDTADDLLQEVFRRAWQARTNYRENGSARAYLIRIADRLLIDRWRRPTAESQVDSDGWRALEPVSRDETPGDRADRLELQQQLAAALEQLSPPQRRVLLLRYYGDMDFAAIAETTSLPLNTVLSHCRRGLLALKKMLAENIA